MRHWVAGRRSTNSAGWSLRAEPAAARSTPEVHLRSQTRGVAISLGKGVDSFQPAMTGTEAMTVEDAGQPATENKPCDSLPR